jgi:hypothetical protein
MLFPFPLPDVNSIVNNAAQSAQVESSVTSTGNSYSSVEVHNTVNANDSGGSSSVDIYTNDNGEVHRETYSSSNTGDIDISTSTPNTHVEVHTSVGGHTNVGWQHGSSTKQWATSSSTKSWDESSSTSSGTPEGGLQVFEHGSFGSMIVHGVFGFFGKIWSIFSR